MTKAAVTGGVTLMLVEPGIYVARPQLGSVLYCDFYTVTVVDDDSLSKVAESRRAGSAAVKAYLYPPSCMVRSVTNLSALFEKAAQHNVPLIVDALLPDNDRIYFASAFHHAEVEGRLTTQLDAQLPFAGAFHYRGDSSSEEEIDLSYHPQRRATHGASILVSRQTNSGLSPAETAEDRKALSTIETTKPTSLVRTVEPMSPQVPRKKVNIYDDLARRIKRNKTNYADLAKIESESYNAIQARQSFEANSGSVVEVDAGLMGTSPMARLGRISRGKGEIGAADITSRHSSELDPSMKASDTGGTTRLRRPPALKMLRRPSYREPRAMTYLKFLVNCPDQWESEGVKQLLNAYQAFPCRLHLANLSSAAAINKVLKLKKKYPDLTCETCPQYLCFTDGTVPPLDTRYKSFPPIRNLNNNILLWELLKVKAIDSIASNHTSVRPDLKFLSDGDFRRAATGFSSLGFAMQAVWGKIRTQTGDFDTLEHYLVRLSKWFSEAPSKLVGIDQLRGSICKGKIADLIIWSPYESVVSEVSHSVFGDTSPFSGMELSGRIERVYVRGRIAFNLGEFKAVGRRLQRTYS
jgi:dihydroorotase-like cyclic amidohydrolase